MCCASRVSTHTHASLRSASMVPHLKSGIGRLPASTQQQGLNAALALRSYLEDWPASLQDLAPSTCCGRGPWFDPGTS